MDQDTLAMREFIEKSVPVLEKSGYKATLCFPETVYFLTWGDYVYFVKDDNGKWIGYPYHGLNGIVNLEAVKEVCRRLEFLDKTVFKGVMSKNKFPCFCSYRMMATDFGSLVSMLRKLYLKKKSPQDKACLQVFNQLIKDKKIDSTEKPLEFYSVLKDEKRGSIPVSELVPANEIFMLSKSNEEFSFSVSSQNQTDVSTSQIRQISGLCRFLSECLFPSKRPVKPHVLIRVNQPKENVETYSAYLSKKMAELFGVDPSGIRESDYLPFLEGFGNLICENEKVKFQRVIYRRVSF